ncbi:MAG: hypothetical protein M3464_06080 [Chloroflexota bacterium]|nr:hypothetical protein [Chloroflexota bacterium]
MTTTTTPTATELGWDATNPATWTLETTVDAHRGYHHTGMVERAYVTITDRADDYESDIDLGDLGWWLDVLPPIHAAKVAIQEASPEALAIATERVGEHPGDYLSNADDLEIGADRSREIVRVLADVSSD